MTAPPPNAPTAAEVECAECGHAREYHRLSVWDACSQVSCGCPRFRAPTAAERAAQILPSGHYAPPPAGTSCLLCGYATTEWAIWTAHGVGLCVSCRDLPNRLDAANAALLAARRENETLRTAANAVIKEHRRLSNLVMGGDTPSLLDLEDAIAALAATETQR